MGSKRSLAPRIAADINERFAVSTIVDAFAGTCAIGTALAPNHPVVANDIHAFATAVARALLVASPPRPSLAAALRELKQPFEENLARLLEVLGDRVRAEQRLLAGCSRATGWQSFLHFSHEELSATPPITIPGLADVQAYRRDTKLQPYALFSMLFASAYFGIRQAAEIDSLRFAIDSADPRHRDFYLVALLHAVSHCSTSPGHFAQHLVPRDEKNTRYIARIRQRSIFKRFLNELSQLESPQCFDRAANAAYQEEATIFIQRVVPTLAGPVVIYVDPPYSRAQYSRYYHVLETLILYDYPEAIGKGRYRTDRFTTDYSRSSGVENAINALVSAAAGTGHALYFSYPQNGLLYKKNVNLRDLLATHYPNVAIVAEATLAHSTLGGAPGTGTINVSEEVFCAHW